MYLTVALSLICSVAFTTHVMPTLNALPGGRKEGFSDFVVSGSLCGPVAIDAFVLAPSGLDDEGFLESACGFLTPGCRCNGILLFVEVLEMRAVPAADGLDGVLTAATD